MVGWLVVGCWWLVVGWLGRLQFNSFFWWQMMTIAWQWQWQWRWRWQWCPTITMTSNLQQSHCFFDSGDNLWCVAHTRTAWKFYMFNIILMFFSRTVCPISWMCFTKLLKAIIIETKSLFQQTDVFAILGRRNIQSLCHHSFENVVVKIIFLWFPLSYPSKQGWDLSRPSRPAVV